MVRNNYKKQRKITLARWVLIKTLNQSVFKQNIKWRLWLQGFGGLTPMPWMTRPNLVKST